MYVEDAMKKIITSGTIAIGLMLAGSAVAGPELGSGGVSLVAPAVHTGAVASSEQAPTVRDTRKPGGHTLRCWHHGRLLYEGSGFRHDLEKHANAINVPRMDGEASAVVLDLKDGMCILTKG
jgi:hypothetical protein